MFLAGAVCSGFCLSSLMSLYVCLYFLCSLWDHMIQMKMLSYFVHCIYHCLAWFIKGKGTHHKKFELSFRMSHSFACVHARAYHLEPITRSMHVTTPYSCPVFSQTDLFKTPAGASLTNHSLGRKLDLNWRHHVTGRLKKQAAIFFFTNARSCRPELTCFAGKVWDLHAPANGLLVSVTLAIIDIHLWAPKPWCNKHRARGKKGSINLM